MRSQKTVFSVLQSRPVQKPNPGCAPAQRKYVEVLRPSKKYFEKKIIKKKTPFYIFLLK